MSSCRKIDSLRKWRLICSASSVFAVISIWIEDNKNNSNYQFSEEEILCFRKMAGKYLINNINQMNDTVVPELKEKAYEMLCEYWGKSAVERFIY